MLQKLLQHQADEAPDPHAFRPEIPGEVTRIVRRMLSKSPDDCYQEPSELVGELLVVAETVGLTSDGRVSVGWGQERDSFHRRNLP